MSVQDVDYRSPDEAMEGLQGRTSRVVRVTAESRRFRLRYRSTAFSGVHVSRTWETNACFDIVGLAVPVLFFPLQGGTTLVTSSGRHDMTPRCDGCFTVAEDAKFIPSDGYSELVLRLDPAVLQAHLRLMEVDDRLPDALRAAALRDDLPGLRRLREMAAEALEPDRAEPAPFRARFEASMAEALTLRAAAILASAAGRELAAPAAEAQGLGAHRALDRAVDYLIARLDEPVRLAEVAAASGVSLRRLQELFRHRLGCSPGEFLRRRRLARAHDLLRSGHVGSVTESAMASGFSHFGKFSAWYRLRYGETPSSTLRGPG
ncbi:helix-turn-helix transcriptional regulator [Alsobacter sp. SYSU BS001988]